MDLLTDNFDLKFEILVILVIYYYYSTYTIGEKAIKGIFKNY